MVDISLVLSVSVSRALSSICKGSGTYRPHISCNVRLSRAVKMP